MDANDYAGLGTVDPYATTVAGMGASYVPTSGAIIQQEGVTEWLQNPREVIKEITLKLKGLEYNKATKQYVRIYNQL